MTGADTVKAVMLAGTDRTLVWLAARLLLALPGGPPRIDAGNGLIQAYRDDVAEAHAGTDPDTLDELAVGFGGSLMLAMLRLTEDDEPDDDDVTPTSGGDLPRPRVLAEIGRFMQAVDPRH